MIQNEINSSKAQSGVAFRLLGYSFFTVNDCILLYSIPKKKTLEPRSIGKQLIHRSRYPVLGK